MSDNPLTQREREVLRGMAVYPTAGDVARHLGIAGPTVRSHLANIRHKLGVHSTHQAVARALRAGWLKHEA